MHHFHHCHWNLPGMPNCSIEQHKHHIPNNILIKLPYCCTKTVSYCFFATQAKCIAWCLTYLPMSFMLHLKVFENVLGCWFLFRLPSCFCHQTAAVNSLGYVCISTLWPALNKNLNFSNQLHFFIHKLSKAIIHCNMLLLNKGLHFLDL